MPHQSPSYPSLGRAEASPCALAHLPSVRALAAALVTWRAPWSRLPLEAPSSVACRGAEGECPTCESIPRRRPVEGDSVPLSAPVLVNPARGPPWALSGRLRALTLAPSRSPGVSRPHSLPASGPWPGPGRLALDQSRLNVRRRGGAAFTQCCDQATGPILSTIRPGRFGGRLSFTRAILANCTNRPCDTSASRPVIPTYWANLSGLVRIATRPPNGGSFFPISENVV